MIKYNVHLYREMRLFFAGIQADSPEAAALIARDKPTGDADDLDDCDGQDLSALVDVAGDDGFQQSVMMDFEGEKQRKAAPQLLAALEAVLPYAENEHASLLECWRRDGESVSELEAERCGSVIDKAKAAIAQAQTVGIAREPAAPPLLDALKVSEGFVHWALDHGADRPAAAAALALIRAAIAAAKTADLPTAPADLDIDGILAGNRQIAAIWGIEDVQEIRPDLTESQCWEVLKAVGREHDSEYGICWATLEAQAEELFGEAPETDEAEEE